VGTTYSQNFDGLSFAGGVWNDGTTVPNWYTLDPAGISATSYALNDGSLLDPGLCAFGNTNDRALGFAPNGNIGETMYVGWRLKNTTGQTIKSISINWTGEQWRADDNSEQYLNLHYILSASPITAIDNGILSSTGFDFITPQIFQNPALVLDGNLPANKVTTTSLITLDIPTGYEIMLVWETTDASQNHFMGLDDVSVTAKASQTISFPSPATKNYGDASFNFGATSTSGLIVSYSSSNTNVATISGSTVTIVGPGKSTITASQAGNSSYTAATNVVRTLNVRPKIPVPIEASNITTTSFQANWTADNGLNDASTSYLLQYANNKSFTSATSTTSTVKNKPLSGLTANTIYFYKIYANANGVISSFSTASAITTGTDYVTQNSGSWDTGSNWDVGYISNIANSITVQHAVNLSTFRDSVTTNTLIIKSTGKLTSSQKIVVLNQLIIEIDASGNTGQIYNTTNLVIATNAKIIIRKSFNENVWNFIGFPFQVNASSIYANGTTSTLTWGDFNLSNPGDFYVLRYDGQQRDNTGNGNYTGEGLNWKDVIPHVFTAKKGYIVATNTSRIIDFTLRGANVADITSLNTVTVPITQYNTNSFAGHRGWNLVTSPFVSAYNLGSALSQAPYYVYNGTNYTVINSDAGATSTVVPFRSYFVQALSSGISFAQGGKRTLAPAAKEVDNFDEINLRLSNGNTNLDDVTQVRLANNASSAYVIGQDAAKLFGMNPTVSYIYSKIDGYGVAVNSLPKNTSNIDFETKFATTGAFTISIYNIDNIANYSAVTLIDKATTNRVDLLTQNTYNFTVNSTGTTNRFSIELSPKIPTGTSVSTNNNILIQSQNSQATLTGLNQSATVKVYDMSGKQIYYNNTYTNNTSINFMSSGLYLFEIKTNQAVHQLKAFIK